MSNKSLILFVFLGLFLALSAARQSRMSKGSIHKPSEQKMDFKWKNSEKNGQKMDLRGTLNALDLKWI